MNRLTDPATVVALLIGVAGIAFFLRDPIRSFRRNRAAERVRLDRHRRRQVACTEHRQAATHIHGAPGLHPADAPWCVPCGRYVIDP